MTEGINTLSWHNYKYPKQTPDLLTVKVGERKKESYVQTNKPSLKLQLGTSDLKKSRIYWYANI